MKDVTQINTNTMSDYKITNQRLFNETVEDIEINVNARLTDFEGEVTLNGNTIGGHHGATDYKEDYGFILISI